MTATRLYTQRLEKVWLCCSTVVLSLLHMYTLETANNRVSILATWTGGEDSPPLLSGYQ